MEAKADFGVELLGAFGVGADENLRAREYLGYVATGLGNASNVALLGKSALVSCGGLYCCCLTAMQQFAPAMSFLSLDGPELVANSECFQVFPDTVHPSLPWSARCSGTMQEMAM